MKEHVTKEELLKVLCVCNGWEDSRCAIDGKECAKFYPRLHKATALMEEFIVLRKEKS